MRINPAVISAFVIVAIVIVIVVFAIIDPQLQYQPESQPQSITQPNPFIPTRSFVNGGNERYTVWTMPSAHPAYYRTIINEPPMVRSAGKVGKINGGRISGILDNAENMAEYLDDTGTTPRANDTRANNPHANDPPTNSTAEDCGRVSGYLENYGWQTPPTRNDLRSNASVIDAGNINSTYLFPDRPFDDVLGL
jgi:hypothetical protein